MKMPPEWSCGIGSEGIQSNKKETETETETVFVALCPSVLVATCESVDYVFDV